MRLFAEPHPLQRPAAYKQTTSAGTSPNETAGCWAGTRHADKIRQTTELVSAQLQRLRR